MTIFGDTDGLLMDHEQGGNQNLFGVPFDTDVVGDARGIIDLARGGDDTVRGVSNGGDFGVNNLYGDALLFMSDKAQGGDDILLVGDNDSGHPVRNFLYGDAHDMGGSAQGGNDLLIGENNVTGGVSNQLFGDALTLSNKAQGGDDNLIGGNQSTSGTGPLGDAGKMLDTTKGGNDVLIAGTASLGGTVNNEMWGDAQTFLSETAKGGADLFMFQDNDGATVGIHNTIYDFSQTQHDQIAFIGVAGVSSFGDLDIDTEALPGSTVITAGADVVTLDHFTGTLTAHDFLFG
jgi:hypothetical protein